MNIDLDELFSLAEAMGYDVTEARYSIEDVISRVLWDAHTGKSNPAYPNAISGSEANHD